jgi:hypothetical protein
MPRMIAYNEDKHAQQTPVEADARLAVQLQQQAAARLMPRMIA